MAFFSGVSIIRYLCLFHLALAYYFMFSPKTLADQNLVLIVGAAMRLPHIDTLDEPSALSSFLAIVFTLFAVNDLVAVSMPEEVTSFYWDNQTPIRLLFFFILTGYTYLTKPGGSGTGAGAYQGMKITAAGPGLQNSLVFSWAFVEMVVWFWVYVTLREERKESAGRRAQKRAVEENSL
ncbi:MAG: hypothetical protein M1838_004457 [Thelocarpon superellum]|nr:MAG: hypothetical protein M1838_004457 [Thelocarpon superellum]